MADDNIFIKTLATLPSVLSAIVAASFCASFAYNFAYFARIEFGEDINYSRAFMPLLSASDYLSSVYFFLPAIFLVFISALAASRLFGVWLREQVTAVSNGIKAAASGLNHSNEKPSNLINSAIHKIHNIVVNLHFYRISTIILLVLAFCVSLLTRNVHIRWSCVGVIIALTYFFVLSKRHDITAVNSVRRLIYMSFATFTTLMALAYCGGTYVATVSAGKSGGGVVSTEIRSSYRQDMTVGHRALENGLFFIDRREWKAVFVGWQGDIMIQKKISPVSKSPIICMYRDLKRYVSEVYQINCTQ